MQFTTTLLAALSATVAISAPVPEEKSMMAAGTWTIKSLKRVVSADQGFTTLSVVDSAAKTIVWPAYTDKQLVNNTVVTPDQSYTPQNLP